MALCDVYTFLFRLRIDMLTLLLPVNKSKKVIPINIFAVQASVLQHYSRAIIFGEVFQILKNEICLYDLSYDSSDAIEEFTVDFQVNSFSLSGAGSPNG